MNRWNFHVFFILIVSLNCSHSFFHSWHRSWSQFPSHQPLYASAHSPIQPSSTQLPSPTPSQPASQVHQTMHYFEQIINQGLSDFLRHPLYNDVPQQNAIYDFIIVGAGPAGCVLANRLSANPKWTVYLIEAGGVEGIIHRTPALATYLQGTASNWGYKSTPQHNACFGMKNNQCSLPRGKILGGTSSINNMIYNRGNRKDFDKWAQVGVKGWSYDEILPYFLRSENAKLHGLENSPYHNHTGPLSVEDVKYRSNIVHAYIKGAQQAGHPRTDYNGESQMGVSYLQATTKQGKRHSAFNAYIEPIRQTRKNLHIVTHAKVIRVVIDPRTKIVTGVKLIYGNRYYKIRARKEVILSAGPFNSPQLLMLSGVGPADNLNAIGIPIIKELPVGKTLYDHMAHFGPTFLTNSTGGTIFVTDINLQIAKSYALGDPNTKLSSPGGVEALTFIKVPSSTEPTDVPDIELITVDGSLASDDGSVLKEMANFKDEIYDRLYRHLADTRQDHFTFLIMQFHPKSVGRLWLHNRDPQQWPHINPKYFYNETDIEFLLEGIKEAIRITKTKAMQSIGARILDTPVPGCEHYPFGSDNYWRCSIKTMSYTLHHQVGTCRMGSSRNPTTVVNSHLKVHGIKHIRVADTSIIPFPPTADTNALSFMIGEKAADIIAKEWRK